MIVDESCQREGAIAFPGHFEMAGREGALPVRADGIGATKVHLKGGGDTPPLVSSYIKLPAKEGPWHANGRGATPVHSKGAGAIPSDGFNPYHPTE